MKKRGKLIWATGISGCGRKEHLTGLKELCKQQGKKIKIYNVGDIMFKVAQLNSVDLRREKILDKPEETLNSLRAAVFERILGKIDNDLAKNDIVVMNLHTVFYWKKLWIPAYNVYYMRRFNPDMFVCFIDSADTILGRLKKRNQWKNQTLTEEKIWDWQNIEFNNTESYKFYFDEKKPCYLVPAPQKAETIYNLVFEPWRPRVYIQMPITNLSDEQLKEVVKFTNWLWKYFTIFDPLTIDIRKTKPKTDEDERSRDQQTVWRDVMHIKQSQICIAYIIKAVFTSGVNYEAKVALDMNKDVYWVFPDKIPGPFEKNLVEPDKIFEELELFKTYVKEVMVPEIEKQKEKHLK